MKYKIAICDDDISQVDFLESILTPWLKINNILADIKKYSSAKSFLFDYESEKDFDILLLDIEMPEINGIELAKTVRKENHSLQIIFITGFYDYFSDGFDVSALHYLIKPVDEGKLFPVLDKAINNLKYRQRSVLINTQDADIKIPLSDIIYIEAENVFINIHTVNGVYRTRTPLTKFYENLDDSFLKVHRSFIVSLSYIKKITKKDLTLISGDIVPISRGMYETVHSALIRYL
ncbi:MAG: response regulator transcription factor [Ruminococcaceae bacterium]|nr:response regulator transcription factor [Oscillospiraceae bacterium]